MSRDEFFENLYQIKTQNNLIYLQRRGECVVEMVSVNQPGLQGNSWVHLNISWEIHKIFAIKTTCTINFSIFIPFKVLPNWHNF